MPHHWNPAIHLPLTPNNTNGTNPPAASASTGQQPSSGTSQGINAARYRQSLPPNDESTRIFVNGLGSGSTSRSPLAQAQAPTVNYQKISSVISAKVGSERKVAHPSAVGPAYPPSLMPPHEMGSDGRNFYQMNPGPSPQSTRADPIRGPSSVRSASTRTSRVSTISEPPPWDGGSEFIDGSTYFKIGDYVYIRRWHASRGVYSPWLHGKVVRPDFRKAPGGQKEERIYVVSYWDSGVQKEQTYSPSLKEIQANFGMSTVAVPATHAVVSANTSVQTSKTASHKNSTVFALLQVTSGSKRYSIWTPSVCLAIENPHGYRVRAIAGPLKNQEFSNVLKVKPYNAETAKDLRDSGHRVEH